MFEAIYSLRSSELNIRGFYHYKYRIEDSDFSEDWVGLSGQLLYRAEVRAGAVIDCYESKEQNVAYNLALYHKYMKDKYYWYNLDDEIKYNIQWTPKYSIYVIEVDKYLKRLDNLKVFW